MLQIFPECHSYILTYCHPQAGPQISHPKHWYGACENTNPNHWPSCKKRHTCSFTDQSILPNSCLSNPSCECWHVLICTPFPLPQQHAIAIPNAVHMDPDNEWKSTLSCGFLLEDENTFMMSGPPGQIFKHFL